jgi:hypothetical protein
MVNIDVSTFINLIDTRKEKIREYDLQEHKHYKKRNYRLKHNAWDESLVACCIYRMYVLKVSDQTTLVVRNS